MNGHEWDKMMAGVGFFLAGLLTGVGAVYVAIEHVVGPAWYVPLAVLGLFQLVLGVTNLMTYDPWRQ